MIASLLAPLFLAALAPPGTARAPRATSPQAAALAVSDRGTAPLVVHTNVAGRYATVLTSGGRFEGTPIVAAILVERFPFGWQTIDFLGDRCVVDAQRLDARTRAALLDGMPRPGRNGDCSGETGDAGPARDVAAVRARVPSRIVPWVVVSHGYALASDYGGEYVFARRRGRWRTIASGDGAYDARDLARRGVPRAARCVLLAVTPLLADAACAARRERRRAR